MSEQVYYYYFFFALFTNYFYIKVHYKAEA